MAYEDMARSHVRQLLRDGMGLEEVAMDGDGDFPFKHGTAMYFVSTVLDGRMARIWSHAVYGVKPTAPVLREVNSTNESLLHGRAFLHGHPFLQHALVIEAYVPIDSLEPVYLASVCHEIGHTADQLGQLLAAVHGGRVFVEDADIEAAG